MKTALVIAAHPDDEVIGCGGTIARMADEGWSVSILILAEGLTSRSPSRDEPAHSAELEALADCGRRAAMVLGAREVQFERFPDNRMDGVELLDVVKRVEREIDRLRPDRVLTHHLGDVNVDHGIVHRAVAAACRPLPGASVRELLYFEVASSTEWSGAHSTPSFCPNLFVDIGATLDRKLRALNEYRSEMRAFPHPRSVVAIEHLSRWRGASAGRLAAEAFEIGRWIE